MAPTLLEGGDELILLCHFLTVRKSREVDSIIDLGSTEIDAKKIRINKDTHQHDGSRWKQPGKLTSAIHSFFFRSHCQIACFMGSKGTNSNNKDSGTRPQSSTMSRLLCFLLVAAVASAADYVDFLVTTQSSNVSNTAQHFVARITEPQAIADARAELNKTEEFKIISGTINATAVEWNPGWSFHLIPDTVFFGDLFTEVCDANVEFVEENLSDIGGAFLPNNQWCPWETRVLEELQPDEGGDPGEGEEPDDSEKPTSGSWPASILPIIMGACLVVTLLF